MKAQRITYWISTILLTLIMLFSAGNYFFNHEFVRQAYLALGYPTYIIYPLGVAKILGLIAIWSHKSKVLEEWAYAGFFFNTLLGVFAHVAVNDGGFAPGLIAFAAVIFSYTTRIKKF